jgi:ParB-like chromosome segregation protein Spo0J
MSRSNKSVERVRAIAIDDIDVGKRMRPLDRPTVDALVRSMDRVGMMNPICLYGGADRVVLVAGAHRLEAAKRLGWSKIDAVFIAGDEVERELREIAENLHRAELNQLERSTQIARWAELTATKVSRVETPLGGEQPKDKGIRKVAAELGIDKSDVQRAVKVASMSDVAKQAVRGAGLDDNRSALLAVAAEPTAEAQVAKVSQIAAAKSAAKLNGKARTAARAIKDRNVRFDGDTLAALSPEFDASIVAALRRLAVICRRVAPGTAANRVRLDERKSLEVDLGILEEWLGRFAVALDCGRAATASPPAEAPVPLTPGKPPGHLEMPDIPAFLDRRRQTEVSTPASGID